MNDTNDQRPRRDDRGKRPARPGQQRPQRPSGRPRRPGDSPAQSDRSPERSPRARPKPANQRPERAPREDSAPRHDDPPVADDATPRELDRAAWRELMALTKENAEWVAGHLVMASRVVDTDPPLAHRHALAAARRAGRIPVVRETLGITAYLTGDYSLALRELRTFRRLSGRNDQLPVMVDCERGLGRPKKALELAGEVDRQSLPPAVAVELAIARSGARLDLGQPDLALVELDIPQLNPQKVFSYSPALFDTYAIVLAELGRTEEAEVWAARADLAAQALADAEGDGDTQLVVDIDEEATP